MTGSGPRYVVFAVGCCVVALAGCAATSTLSQAAGKPATASAVPELLLRENFEQRKVAPSGKPTHDFLPMTTASGRSGNATIQYEGGTPDDRYADVVDDPKRAGNKVLHFWLKGARIGRAGMSGHYKGRVQLILPDVNQTSVYQRYRMYLHPDVALYRSYPKDNVWFTINEFWFGAPWKGERNAFRISLNIVKQGGDGKPLWLAANADMPLGNPKQGRWSRVWDSVNKDFEVPVGEWLDVEVGYKQGNASSGRFYVAVTPASTGKKIEVMNVTNWTYHPQAPRPIPLTHWQPLKLYTSAEIIEHVRNKGGVLQIYWDDLEIWKGWRQ